MVRRCYLTENLVDTLQPPASGEIWIPDTALRGFGVRLWASNSSLGMAYAFRSSDKNGKSFRRTYNNFHHDYWKIRLRFWNTEIPRDKNGDVKFSLFLTPARNWARTEIDRLKGKLPSNVEVAQAREEYQNMKAEMGAVVSQKTIGSLVDIVLSYGSCRGWSLEYCDRLQRAFYSLDSTISVQNYTIEELSDGRLIEIIRRSRISYGNFRMLRLLLKTVLTNVEAIGGPCISDTLPNGADRLFPDPSIHEEFLNHIRPKDVTDLISQIHQMDFDWRLSTFFELSLRFGGPVSRLMRAQWHEIIEGIWFPYRTDERKYWFYTRHYFGPNEYRCIKFAREKAALEGIESSYWFPSKLAPSRHISNVDRYWQKLVERIDWPKVTLSKTASVIRQRQLLFEWPSKEEIELRENIRVVIKEWGSVLKGDA